jgi:hypothetical protein
VLTVTKRRLAQIKAALKRHGITHDRVAASARRPVARTTVVHVLAGRVKSRNVLEAAERLLAEARQRQDSEAESFRSAAAG